MLTPQQLEEFNRNGFINAGPILDDSEIEELRAELARIMEIGPDGFEE
ncbi:uncharacterized protein METZ01_LOCUS489719, partial [marine metagenome]